MAYMDAKTPADRAKSIGAVIAVHAGLAYALVVGLTFAGVIAPPPAPFKGETITKVPVDPPPPPPDPKPTQDATPRDSYVYTPPRHVEVSDNQTITTVDSLPKSVELATLTLPPIDPPEAGPGPKLFDVVSPKPKNDSSKWVTTDDYRSSWISREYTGVARFRLEVGADGKVKDCQIIRSSGHSELDRATCDLVSRRAKFSPGQDSTGARAAGTYTSAVSWQLPE